MNIYIYIFRYIYTYHCIHINTSKYPSIHFEGLRTLKIDMPKETSDLGHAVIFFSLKGGEEKES